MLHAGRLQSNASRSLLEEQMCPCTSFAKCLAAVCILSQASSTRRGGSMSTRRTMTLVVLPAEPHVAIWDARRLARERFHFAGVFCTAVSVSPGSVYFCSGHLTWHKIGRYVLDVARGEVALFFFCFWGRFSACNSFWTPWHRYLTALGTTRLARSCTGTWTAPSREFPTPILPGRMRSGARD